MKKVFESPKVELCEFVVAARLNGSGTGHEKGNQTTCSMVSSNGGNSCDDSSNDTSKHHSSC